MKTLQTLATVLLAAFLVLAPTVAFAASATLTIAPTQSSYNGNAAVTLSGTVTPTPNSSNTAVTITTKNPQGVVVDIGLSPVSSSTGGYSYTLVAGASSWTSGTYTVTAIWGAGGVNASASTTFQYAGFTASSSSSAAITVQAPTIAWAGKSVGIAVLTPGNSTVTVQWLAPGGSTLQAGPTMTQVTPFLYVGNIALPANATDGAYFLYAKVVGAGGVSWGLGQFTVSSGIATAAQQTALQTAMNGLTSSVGTMTSGVSAMQQSLSTLSTKIDGVQSGVNTVSAGVNSITNSLSSLTNSLNGLSGISGQIGSINSAISNNQTYVLVVAALAAITLVLELAILVRKLS